MTPNQQQPIVPIQQLFQHSSQLGCSPADVGSNERRPKSLALSSVKPVTLLVVYEIVSRFFCVLNFSEFY